MAPIHIPSFLAIPYYSCINHAIQEIDDLTFWNTMNCILKAIFPTLRALQHSDANALAMDKFFDYLCW